MICKCDYCRQSILFFVLTNLLLAPCIKCQAIYRLLEHQISTDFPYFEATRTIAPSTRFLIPVSELFRALRPACDMKHDTEETLVCKSHEAMFKV